MEDGEKCSSTPFVAAACDATEDATDADADDADDADAAREADDEAWSERTAVITKYDHETNCQLARDVVQDIADSVVHLTAQLPQRKFNSDEIIKC